MARYIKKASKAAGQVPGTLVHVGKEHSASVKISVMDYNEERFEEMEIKDVSETKRFIKDSSVSWINIDGVHDTDIIEKIGDMFGIHPLVLEDIVNTTQRPKMEEHDGYLYLVLKMIRREEPSGDTIYEQVSLILGKGFVLSFQEKEGDVFEPVRDRIRRDKGRIRKKKADYLVYSLIDAVVDNYFVILERLGEEMEKVEENITADPTSDDLKIIHRSKREVISLRRSVWPLREVIGALIREDDALINKDTGIFFRDVYDHTIQVIDTVEALRDTASGMLDIYLSIISNKMNEVMKVLTIIATIFIPLTFVAGIYGMNFNPETSRFNMPELNWPYGYLFAWAIMLTVGGLMLRYFRKKKWM
ncbi:MAG: magnesium/cobalt transporter CorA [Candidatus Omnitrophota bacterium]|nr:magnesium/cobalt transporter CorA [Candidatus Omnitrophota bacterium]